MKLKDVRTHQVNSRVDDMMQKLDYSKHDKRNGKDYVKQVLAAHYARCLDSIITPAQFDEMFAIYTPYNGTF